MGDEVAGQRQCLPVVLAVDESWHDPSPTRIGIRAKEDEPTSVHQLVLSTVGTVGVEEAYKQQFHCGH